MVVWVSTIVFRSIPTCIFTKCAINLGPKVWYNMRLKNKFHIIRVNNKTSIPNMAEVVLDSCHFNIFLRGCPLINIPLHQGDFMALITVSKFRNSCMWDVCMLNLDYMCPSMSNILSPHQVHVVKR
jgi:hypothetical protein